MTAYKYVFGPVPSRRLGRSLGVDLVRPKACCFDCVYCQLGRTRETSTDRLVFMPLDAILSELRDALSHIEADFVTLSGSGEPTLHAQLGEIINGIRDLTDTPVAVLTNGALLFDASVREACGRADVVLPTLAATTEEQFAQIHRPHAGLNLEQHIAGLAAMSQEQPASMWLELFVIAGANDSDADLAAFEKILHRIQPERIQLNTAVRPAADRSIRPVPAARLHAWAARLGPRAEVIANYPDRAGSSSPNGSADIIGLCRRHPCTLSDIARAIGTDQQAARDTIERLLRDGALTSERHDGQVYYIAPLQDT